jgi:hypothetical protein
MNWFPGDGFYLNPYYVIVSSVIYSEINFQALREAIGGKTFKQYDANFRARLEQMTNEDFEFIYSAWWKSPSDCTYAERMALARVCRRMIREAKESQQ